MPSAPIQSLNPLIGDFINTIDPFLFVRSGSLPPFRTIQVCPKDWLTRQRQPYLRQTGCAPWPAGWYAQRRGEGAKLLCLI
jgi:hypothetical protein